MDAYASQDLIGTITDNASVIHATKITQIVHDSLHATKHQMLTAHLTPLAHVMRAKSAMVLIVTPINVTTVLIDVANTQSVR